MPGPTHSAAPPPNSPAESAAAAARHLVDAQIGVDRLAELVHRGAAGDEILHHLRGHGGRIGRDPARCYAVIAGKDGGARMVDAGRVLALPGRKPLHELLEPAERAGGLGELRLARRRRRAGLQIRPRQDAQQRAHLVERRERLVLRHGGFPCWSAPAAGTLPDRTGSAKRKCAAVVRWRRLR